MVFRSYDPERDRDAVYRIWFETSWLEKGKEEMMDVFVGSAKAMVAELDGEAETLVLSTPGTLRYQEQGLPVAGITGVTTSRIARKQGFASRLTARSVAANAAEGAQVVGLGMFDQGFYNQLGFGTGGYDYLIKFDPAHLEVPVTARVPRRLTVEDHAMIHASRLARRRLHGAFSFFPADMTRAEMMWTKNGFGLGYCDGPNGELTHHLWCKADGGHGPYRVNWMSYQTTGQWLELMALLKNLGDQVHVISMSEPPGIQLQDLLTKPFRRRSISEKSKYETGIEAWAWWQARICDLPGCLSHTRLEGESVQFNLRLTDPIADFLPEDAPWPGVGGEYVVALGRTSSAEQGTDPTLPTLSASVGAFTRLWLGVLPGSGLSVTDDLEGPPSLIEALDRVVRLPRPRPDWDF